MLTKRLILQEILTLHMKFSKNVALIITQDLRSSVLYLKEYISKKQVIADGKFAGYLLFKIQKCLNG